MASLSGASTPVSGAATPRSKLEQLPKEDLIRFVKKQLLNLKQAKERIQALENKVIQNDNLDQKCTELEEEVENLKSEKVIETESLSQKCAQLELEVSSLKSEKASTSELQSVQSAEWEERLDNQTQEECQLLRQALSDRALLCDELHDENERLTQQLMQIKKGSDDSQAELTEANKSIEVLERCQTELKEQNTVLSGQMKTAEQFRISSQELEERNASLLQQLELKQRELNDANTKMTQMQTNNQPQTFEDELSHVQTSLEESQQQCQQLSAANHSLEDQLSRVQAQSEQTHIAFKETQDSLSEVNNRLRELEAELRDAQDTSASLEAELREARDNSLVDVRTGTDIQTQTELNEEKEKETALLLQELASSQSKTHELQERLDNAESVNENQKVIIEQLSARLEQRELESSELKTSSQQFKNQLDDLKEKMSGQNVLSLEMADYEKSLQRMHEQVGHLETLVQSKTNENQSVKKELDTLREQKAKSDANVNKLKSAFVKIKKDCAEAKDTAQNRSAEVGSLETKVQELTEEIENLKMQLSSSVGDGELRVSQLESAVHSLQRQLTAAQQSKQKSQHELTAIREEFDTYKVRVHSVLKQQQTKSNAEEEWGEERKHLSATVEQLQEKLAENSLTCRTAQQELCSVQEECESLNQRLRQSHAANESARHNFNKLLEQQKQEYEHKLVTQKDATERLNAEQFRIEQAHKVQLASLEADYSAQLARVHEQLASAESRLHLLSQNQEKSSSSRESSTEIAETNANIPPFSERKPAEGSESTEINRNGVKSPPLGLVIEHRSSAIEPQSPTSIPLDELLNTSDRLSISSSVPPSPLDQLSHTQSCLSLAQRRVEHLNELLNESEDTNARLSEQIKLLKEEIRRLERNQEREQHLENYEYLKNVFIKFVTSDVGDQKARLVPVLTTMLRLSTEETDLFNTIATGSEKTVSGAGGGWSSYLHRWSGLT